MVIKLPPSGAMVYSLAGHHVTYLLRHRLILWINKRTRQRVEESGIIVYRLSEAVKKTHSIVIRFLLHHIRISVWICQTIERTFSTVPRRARSLWNSKAELTATGSSSRRSTMDPSRSARLLATKTHWNRMWIVSANSGSFQPTFWSKYTENASDADFLVKHL